MKFGFCQSASVSVAVGKTDGTLNMTIYTNFCSTFFVPIYGRVIKSDKRAMSISEQGYCSQN